MIKALEQAVAELSRLPEADQEQISREILTHVEKLNALRVDLDAGIRSLNAGKGTSLDINEFLRRKNAGYDGA